MDTPDDSPAGSDPYKRAAWICAALGWGYFLLVAGALALTVGVSALIRPQNGFFYVVVMSPAALFAAAGAVCWRQSLTAGLGSVAVSAVLLVVVTIRYWLG